MIKKNNGITLMAMVVMVIVILILAGISITEGTSIIKKTKLENMVTNMITIKAKAKVYDEEINAEIWDSDDKSTKRISLYESKYNMIKIDSSEISSKLTNTTITSENYECYQITQQTLEYMGLDNLIDETNDGDYIVVYNSDDHSELDIIYKQGMNYDGSTYYTLSSMQDLLGETN